MGKYVKALIEFDIRTDSDEEEITCELSAKSTINPAKSFSLTKTKTCLLPITEGFMLAHLLLLSIISVSYFLFKSGFFL